MKRYNRLHTKLIKNLISIVCIIIIAMSLAGCDDEQKTVKTSKNSKILVALGDSYSAGEGIPPFIGQDKSYEEKIDDSDWLSHRSTKAWPLRLDFKDSNTYFVAVSGATTKNLYSSHPYAKKQSKEAAIHVSDGLTVAGFIYTNEKKLPYQYEIFKEIGKNKADYITMTMGGNDVGFADVVKEAVLGSTYLNTSSLERDLNNTWKDFYGSGKKEESIRQQLFDSYIKLSEEAGEESVIIIAGYPRLLDETGKGVFISQKEAEIINDSVTQFNKEIRNLVNAAKAKGVKICFVSVEEGFKGHGAYSDDPYINKVMLTQAEDINCTEIASAYSMHPNDKGAQVYADCVQAKIDELEKDGIDSDDGQSVEWVKTKQSGEKNVVLTLDVSGSMEGQPIDETKSASTKFVNTISNEDAAVGIVCYDSEAMMISDFNMSTSYLNGVIADINAGGGTNMEAGLREAYSMLQNTDSSQKIIFLMGDGMPNEGKQGSELIAYADEIKNDGVYIYTLGFFSSLSGSEKVQAQELMEAIASSGCHYEVEDVEDIIYSFNDVADQLNGQKYIYIKIDAPANVVVKYGDEKLNSNEEHLCKRTEFGTLTFEENSEEGAEPIKVLRLKEGAEYQINIDATQKGKMNYTIGFMDEDGEYSDMRYFKNIKLKEDGHVDSIAAPGESTTLNVDEDGDGKKDLTYKAGKNSKGKEITNTILYVIFFVVCGIVFSLDILFAILRFVRNYKYNKELKNMYYNYN